MGSRGIGVFLTTVVFALAGCGDDDGDKGDSGGGDTREALSQDAEAKSNARLLVTALESCYAEQQDYSACKDTAAADAQIDVGDATVETADAGTFTVVSPSESENVFRLEKAKSGVTTRSCEPPGAGGCGPDGTW